MSNKWDKERSVTLENLIYLNNIVITHLDNLSEMP